MNYQQDQHTFYEETEQRQVDKTKEAHTEVATWQFSWNDSCTS